MQLPGHVTDLRVLDVAIWMNGRSPARRRHLGPEASHPAQQRVPGCTCSPRMP